MTTDIIKRLRFNQQLDDSFGITSALYKEAADYIEQLEGQLSAQRQDSDKVEQAAMYQWIRSRVSEDMQWYLFGHVVNSPEDCDIAIRAAIANGAPK